MGEPIHMATQKKHRQPRLTVKGSVQKQKFDWSDAIIDSIIVSGLTFFSTLGGGSVAGLNGMAGLNAAAVAASAQFFVFLALKRGIVQQRNC